MSRFLRGSLGVVLFCGIAAAPLSSAPPAKVKEEPTPKPVRDAREKSLDWLTKNQADNGSWGERLVEPSNVARAQNHVESADILVEIPSLLGARNGNDVVALGEHPGERELRGGAALRGSHLLYVLNERQIASEILVLKQWRLPTEIAGFEIFNVTESASEKTASERTIGNKTNSKFANRRENLGCRIPAPQRIFALERGDGMDRMRPPKGCRRRFG